jgi:hypothetical protein
MPNENFMLEATARDFDVDQIASNGEFTLYGALRKGGTELIEAAEGTWTTHVAGVWHFVVLHSIEDNVNRVEQLHIPRYQMAEMLSTLLRAGDQHPGSRPIQNESLVLLQGDKIGFVGFGNWFPGQDLPLSTEFTEKLRSDLPLLDQAQSLVEERDDIYFLPSATTPAGHPVESPSYKLIQAIAFEKLTLGKLDAGNFGIYSAYCTYRDFETSVQMPDDLIAQLIEGQFGYSSEDVDAETLELFMDTQKKVLTQPIWGEGISMYLVDAAKILSQGMASLTRTQRVQFCLMNGMHSAGLFLPLATVTGVISFDRYAQLKSQGLQPDSPEEQDLRKETAYIQLYGELA